MKTITRSDLRTLAARLIEVFELEEYTREQAIAVVPADDFDRLVPADYICRQPGLFGGCVFTNRIPPEE
ncbi:MAG: hypothetical protein RIF32_10000 [Leptospirales bacterium]|jgi:hypothetical protein